MAREWTDDEKASWFAAHEQTNLAAEPALVSHVVTYRPDIRIHVLVPPWTKPDEWFQEARQGWDEWLWDTPASTGPIQPTRH